MGAQIVLTHVKKSYETPPLYVVDDFSLTVTAGEFFCLVGASGCGKSTVLKMIAGIEQPTSGTIDRPHSVGMVFQSYALLPWLSVEDNVAFPARMHGVDRDRIAEITERYLQMVHLQAFRKKYPRELSGGQRQRVGIARALAVESDVLLMDEPFSALDPVICTELYADLLDIWQKTQKTVLLVSHNFEEAAILAGRIGVMKDGALCETFPVTLPRPRNEDDPAFARELKTIRDCLSAG